MRTADLTYNSYMITDLRIQQFRSYGDNSFELNRGVNIIVGPNASGKTNLLEAVLVLASGSSYRAGDAELVRHKRAWARLDSHSQNSSTRTVKIAAGPKPAKTFEIDGKEYKRLSLAHSLPAVLFEPNHLLLFTGGPEKRRDYLDSLLEQTIAGYATTKRQYRRALAQRNNLLKQGHSSEFFPWNVRLSQLGGQVARARTDLVSRINKDLPKLYKELAQSKTKVSLEYSSGWPVDTYETQFLRQLETDEAEDRLRGFTGSGPHREDLIAYFGGRPAQQTASRGEIRTAVLAQKIIELKIIEDLRGSTPLLLLDDVFSELDGRRRHALTDYLAPYQTFITTTDADIVLKHFTNNTNIIPLK
jgi:DNA replication and repair protein RecF